MTMKNEKLTHWRGRLLLLFLFGAVVTFAQGAKTIYVPTWMMGDVNNPNNDWSLERSKQSENFIIFWEPGYGENPSTLSDANYRVNIDGLLDLAEECFDFYTDSLKFIKRGSSKTDNYKMIIRLRYTRDWEATGSGVDDKIGLLTLTAWSAQAGGHTLAHEVGHCFQYQVHCDGWPGGWMYGFGDNASGGNCFWEQCAQWQGFKLFPEQQFTDYRYSEYLNNTYRHILHEAPRYANYFIQDYWCDLHGMDMIGRLWRESKSPEDPVETYKRLTGINQSKFNDEIYDCAARFVTWDIPALRKYGESTIDARPQCKMNRMEDDYWQVDSVNCVENYGYNVIKLNAPSEASEISVAFESQLKAKGFRSSATSASSWRISAGWRYGFVALLKDGTRLYSDMRSISYNTMVNLKGESKDTLRFACPENCEKLWLVVTGAPKTHWRHAWDDNDANDEQWPYRVKFENTNLYGVYDFGPEDVPYDATVTTDLMLAPVTTTSQPYPSTPVQPNVDALCRAFCLSLPDLIKGIGSQITYCAVNPNGTLNYTSTANAPGHWFTNTGTVTNWGNNSYIFSELNTGNLTFNIGQYPNKCKNGDKYTIRQALVYKPQTGSSVRATFVFNITIATPSGVEDVYSEPSRSILCETGVTDVLRLTKVCVTVIVRDMSGRVLKQVSNTDEILVNDLPSGIYLVTIDGVTTRFVKQ